MNLNQSFQAACMLLLSCFLVTGCGDAQSAALQTVKEINKTNVGKVRTCFVIFNSRNGRAPNDQEELVAFLKGGTVDKNLERIEITSDTVDKIFTSERDGEPLKIKWGVKMGDEATVPIAFETVGVDGIRLVGADVIVEVDNDEEYEKMWNGDYVSLSDQLREKFADDEQ